MSNKLTVEMSKNTRKVMNFRIEICRTVAVVSAYVNTFHSIGNIENLQGFTCLSFVVVLINFIIPQIVTIINLPGKNVISLPVNLIKTFVIRSQMKLLIDIYWVSFNIRHLWRHSQ